ncbi:MAG: MFS transporter [Paracoccaceae bacterium]
MRIMITFAALLLSVTLLQLHSGAMGPLDALAGLAFGFSSTQVGMLGSAHFVGFFIGCWWAPRLLGAVGHTRGFAAFAALGAIGAIAHPIFIGPYAWALLRIMTGLAVAGCFTIVEAWLHAKVTNANRGRVLGAYRVVDMGASFVAQLLIGVLDPVSYVSYNIMAILCCAAIMPLMLTRSVPPNLPEAPRLRPIKTMLLSPLAAAGVMVAGVTSPAFRMVGPVYGQEVGLRADQIGLFLATAVAGGAISQIPAGWLADRYDRRHVLTGISLAAVAVCLLTAFFGQYSHSVVFVAAFLFGITTFPIFSISSAHANDFAAVDDMVEVAASLMFLYGIGAIASPLLASILIDNYGAGSLFVMMAVAHIFLSLFGLYRMRARPTRTRSAYSYVPRTSFVLGRLFKRRNGDQ